jgi:prepilin-type N-terminal cleavage/methylation domain-containing protein
MITFYLQHYLDAANGRNQLPVCASNNLAPFPRMTNADQNGNEPKRAFTLVELLVVIAVVAILASILLPTLSRMKERARRTECLNNVRQLILSCHVYANDHDNRLPAPGTNVQDQSDTHTPVFGTNGCTAFLSYTALSALDCPNLRHWMQEKHWRNQPEYGIAIGYHYLGGHPGTPWDAPPGTSNYWKSPQSTTEDPLSRLVADLNVYSSSITEVLAPHCRAGPIVRDGRYYLLSHQSGGWSGLWNDDPVKAGAQGANIGLLNGSVAWRPMSRLTVYKASHLWDTSGAYGYW